MLIQMFQYFYLLVNNKKKLIINSPMIEAYHIKTMSVINKKTQNAPEHNSK